MHIRSSSRYYFNNMSVNVCLHTFPRKRYELAHNNSQGLRPLRRHSRSPIIQLYPSRTPCPRTLGRRWRTSGPAVQSSSCCSTKASRRSRPRSPSDLPRAAAAGRSGTACPGVDRGAAGMPTRSVPGAVRCAVMSPSPARTHAESYPRTTRAGCAIAGGGDVAERAPLSRLKAFVSFTELHKGGG